MGKLIRICCLLVSISVFAEESGPLLKKHHTAEEHSHEAHHLMPTPKYPQSPGDCSSMQFFDLGMWMCMPLTMEKMPMSMVMVSGNIFGGYTAGEKPRGRDALYSTNMVMLDVGTSLGNRHYLNLDLMMTSELWTVPADGYPLLLQVGEHNQAGVPFIDAQHPHSSPIMGLTFSDTIRLSDGSNALKLFFAPRGEVTDGPVAFMHRPTGMINSDAPLGHHIGQDVGHISSTVLGSSLKWGTHRVELSVFNGEEPKPSEVDLPLGTPNSASFRVVKEWNPDFLGMVSVAYLHHPEHDEPELDHRWRLSGSFYHHFSLSDEWDFHHTFIYGGITNYDNTQFLNSFLEEFWLTSGAPNFWGRIEVLQRTPAQLQVATTSNPNEGMWVAAVTLGYTHSLTQIMGATLGIGASITKNFLPASFESTYRGEPVSGKVFLHLKGMRMWHE